MTPVVKELIRRLDCVVVEDARKQSRAPASAAVYYLPEDVPTGTEKKDVGNNNETMWATVVWPGKDFDGNFGARTSCTVQLADGTEKKMGARPGSGKSNYLKSLKKGDKVPVYWDSMTKDNEKIDYLDVDTWALIESGGAGGASAGADHKKGFMEAFSDSRKCAKWFQEQGIALATELFADLIKSESLEVGAVRDFDEGVGYAIFERGGALGTSLHMDMIAKGYR